MAAEVQMRNDIIDKCGSYGHRKVEMFIIYFRGRLKLDDKLDVEVSRGWQQTRKK